MLILNPNAFRNVATRLLFRVDAETAHALSAAALKQRWLWQSLEPLLSVRDSSLETDLAGLRLRSPVGLAAGFDKNCEMLPSLAALGFGYVTGGTVTRQPQPGNPPPRVFRYERDDSLINAMGFPNLGVMHAARRLRRDRERVGAPVVVSVSGETSDTIASCHRAVEPLCDAVEVNVSSPNTRGLRVFQQPAALSDLLETLGDRQIAVCRELTKLHEEVWRGTLSEAADYFESPRGEFVLVIAGAEASGLNGQESSTEQAREQLTTLRQSGSRAREAVAEVVAATGLPRSQVYRLWLETGK